MTKRPRPGIALLAGLCGGVVLDALETATPHLSSLEVSLAKEAADLLTADPSAQRVVRRAIPLGLGAAFGLGYAWWWRREACEPTTPSALTLGAAHGLLTAATAPLARRLRPRDVDLPAASRWVLGEVVDHAAYALTTAFVYRVLTDRISSSSRK